MADPTRAAILELDRAPLGNRARRALDVPRTRLYHHIELLREKGLVEQVDERRVGALTERIYALTAKTFRASARLVHSGDPPCWYPDDAVVRHDEGRPQALPGSLEGSLTSTSAARLPS